MSEYSFFDFDREERHQAYLERQARREASHLAYLERQRRREERHQAYLERQARREANRIAYFSRITENVLRFRAQYTNILDDLRRQGLDVYVKQEYDSIVQRLNEIDKLLAAENVESARDLSMEIGQSIHGLFSLARQEKRRVTEHLRDDELQRKEEIQKQARQDFIEQLKRNLEPDRETSPQAVQEAVKKLDAIKESAASLSDNEFQNQLIEEGDKIDEEIVDETVRREVVKAIYLSLKKTGFIVNAPQMSGEVVLLKAQKPAGQQAEFTVKIDGGLTFKFDNYEGQKCKKDIDDVTSLLAECYGVKLSNRKVQWSNPDRIQKGSKENPSGGNINTANK